MKISELFEEDAPDIIDLIKRDCQQFIEAHPDGLMFRGMDNKSMKPFKGTVRQDRKPVNMSKEKHKRIDDWFEKEFGFKARSQSIFVTGEFDDARSYGQPYAIFPIGEFEFVWSPQVGDMFMYNFNDSPLDEAGYKDTDLKAAINSENEIMLYCKEYYALPIGNKAGADEWLRRIIGK